MACRKCALGWLLGLAFVVGCRQAPEIPRPAPGPITELEAKIRTIEGLRALVRLAANEENRAEAEADLQWWLWEFDKETGKVTEPVVLYPGPLETAEDRVRRAYWAHIRSIEGYENMMLTDPAFGPSPEALKGIARRREECLRMFHNLSAPGRSPVPKEALDWQAAILQKRKSLREKGPAAWQRPLVEEMVRWWGELGQALRSR